MRFYQYANTYHKWSWGISDLGVSKSQNPVKIGVLSAADFTNVGLFDPARTHPDCIVTAIAARSLEKAQAQAKQYGIPRAFGSYQELVELEELDAVYIPLPIAFHAEWAMKAARAGKHVLIEKPICSNEEEAKAIQKCAHETGKVILEGFHWQFHPVAHVTKALVDSGKYGRVQSIHADLWSADNFPEDDIRSVYALGGGAAMDLGYVFSAIEYFVGGNGHFEVTKATPRLHQNDKLVDERIEAEMTFHPSDKSAKPITCTVAADLKPPYLLGFIPKPVYPQVIIDTEVARMTLSNYVAPHLKHDLRIDNKATGVKTSETHFNFGPKYGARSEMYWTTYRYQLEAFIAKIRGEEPPHWIELEDSVTTRNIVDQVYDKAGLPRRGFKLDQDA